MSANSAISWTDHTFNPWWGCVESSPGCTNCYARAWAHRLGLELWGKGATRRFFGPKHWAEPLEWDRKAAEGGVRAKVFCASMADVCEDRADLVESRKRLEELIHRTESLVWILCTKHPENYGLFSRHTLRRCCTLTTAERQQELDARGPHLLGTEALCRGVSLEPLLGPVGLARHFPSAHGLRDDLFWVICGGESGPNARPCNVQWIRDVVRQCREAHVPVHLKQLGSKPTWLEGRFYAITDRAGRIVSEWPADLQDAREWPEVMR